MVTPGYSCGLDDLDTDYPEIQGWREQAHVLAKQVVDMRRAAFQYRRLEFSGLPCLVEVDQGGHELGRTAVIHALWRRDAEVMRPLLGEEWTPTMTFVDTFELQRRPLRKLQEIKALTRR
jgi:hypothetical protein